MRQILIDNARRKQSVKHGGRLERVELDEIQFDLSATDVDVLALDEALNQFAIEHPEKAELVQLRFFVQLSIEEVAEVMNISPSTAARHWRYARAWLAQKLRE